MREISVEPMCVTGRSSSEIKEQGFALLLPSPIATACAQAPRSLGRLASVALATAPSRVKMNRFCHLAADGHPAKPALDRAVVGQG